MYILPQRGIARSARPNVGTLFPKRCFAPKGKPAARVYTYFVEYIARVMPVFHARFRGRGLLFGEPRATRRSLRLTITPIPLSFRCARALWPAAESTASPVAVEAAMTASFAARRRLFPPSSGRGAALRHGVVRVGGQGHARRVIAGAGNRVEPLPSSRHGPPQRAARGGGFRRPPRARCGGLVRVSDPLPVSVG